jgi:hypothetical protein
MKPRLASSLLLFGTVLAVSVTACETTGEDETASVDQAVASCTQFDRDLRAVGYKADLLNREKRRANHFSFYEHSFTEVTELKVADLARHYRIEGGKTSAHDPAFASQVESIAAECAFYLFADAPAEDRSLVQSMAKELAKTAAQELAGSDQYVYRVKPNRDSSEDSMRCGLAFETGLNHEVVVVQGKWSD